LPGLAALLAAALPATGLAAAAPPPAAAGQQGGGMDFAENSGAPLEIYADQGLELSQDDKTIIGRVNAKAIRGRVTVTADILIAHYRPKQPAPGQPAKPKAPAAPKPGEAKSPDDAGGGSEVWRVEAEGHVTVATPTQTAYGDHGDYDIDQAVVVLTGKDLRLVTPTDVITARDSLEYWEHRQQAVARGNAVAVRADKRIQADTLVADFAEGADKRMSMQRAHGYERVVLTTPTEVVTGRRADYTVETGIVTVLCSAKISRGNDQLNGEYAVVNLDTGISRIYPNGPGGKQPGCTEDKVNGLFVPQKKSDPAATATPSAGASVPPR
jgi:lipopolysaccharide export system protein LptA